MSMYCCWDLSIRRPRRFRLKGHAIANKVASANIYFLFMNPPRTPKTQMCSLWLNKVYYWYDIIQPKSRIWLVTTSMNKVDKISPNTRSSPRSPLICPRITCWLLSTRWATSTCPVTDSISRNVRMSELRHAIFRNSKHIQQRITLLQRNVWLLFFDKATPLLSDLKRLQPSSVCF